MNDDLDQLLQSDLLQPPAQFTQRVMQQLQALPRNTSGRRLPPGLRSHLRWLVTATGLAGAGLLGLSQLAAFVFGLWLASSAL